MFSGNRSCYGSQEFGTLQMPNRRAALGLSKLPQYVVVVRCEFSYLGKPAGVTASRRRTFPDNRRLANWSASDGKFLARLTSACMLGSQPVTPHL